MAVSIQWISDLFTHVQADFLDIPGLGLTVDDAAMRFGINPATSEAVLSTLAEAGVLSRDREGIFTRNLRGPRRRQRPSRRSAATPRSARASRIPSGYVCEEARS